MSTVTIDFLTYATFFFKKFNYIFKAVFPFQTILVYNHVSLDIFYTKYLVNLTTEIIFKKKFIINYY